MAGKPTDPTEVVRRGLAERPMPDRRGEAAATGAGAKELDTDLDGLSDQMEAKLGTDPTLADTDGDGVSDGDEVDLGTDPLLDDFGSGQPVVDNSRAGPGDTVPIGSTDNSRVPDDPDPTDNSRAGPGDIVAAGTVDNSRVDPDDVNYIDSDGDGIPDKLEIEFVGSDPNNPDTDGDGIEDLVEFNQYMSDPTNADTDGDGLLDGFEAELGTDLLDADTDGDGILDGVDDDPLGA